MSAPTPAPTAVRVCTRCGRAEGSPNRRGDPLRFHSHRSKYAAMCQPCAQISREYPDRPPLITKPPKRCRICKRRKTRTGRPLKIIYRGKWPGLCTSCRITMERRTRTYPVKPCTGCQRTHTRTGRLVTLTSTGPYAGLCITCRHHKHKEQTSHASPTN